MFFPGRDVFAGKGAPFSYSLENDPLGSFAPLCKSFTSFFGCCLVQNPITRENVLTLLDDRISKVTFSPIFLADGCPSLMVLSRRRPFISTLYAPVGSFSFRTAKRIFNVSRLLS